MRVVTHPRVFAPPVPLAEALEFAETLRAQPNVVMLGPGPRHWEIFAGPCRQADARGNLVADAFFAAVAIDPRASGSPPTATSAGSPDFAGATRWVEVVRPPAVADLFSGACRGPSAVAP